MSLRLQLAAHGSNRADQVGSKQDQAAGLGRNRRGWRETIAVFNRMNGILRGSLSCAMVEALGRPIVQILYHLGVGPWMVRFGI